MNRTPRERKAAEALLDAATEVASLVGGPDYPPRWGVLGDQALNALAALYGANELWQDAQEQAGERAMAMRSVRKLKRKKLGKDPMAKYSPSRFTVKSLAGDLPTEFKVIRYKTHGKLLEPFPEKPKKTARKAAFDKEWDRIKKVVFARAGRTQTSPGQCEIQRGGWRCMGGADEGHHCFGRIRVPQSESNVLAICSTHHRAVTRNEPDAASWWAWIARSLEALGFVTEAQLADSNAVTASWKTQARKNERRG